MKTNVLSAYILQNECSTLRNYIVHSLSGREVVLNYMLGVKWHHQEMSAMHTAFGAQVTFYIYIY